MTEAFQEKHAVNSSLPATTVFLAASSQDSALDIREGLNAFLTDTKWKYVWRKEMPTTETHKLYVLNRRVFTKEELKEYRIKAGLERLKYLRSLIDASDERLAQLRLEDPDLADDLDDHGIYEGGLKLLSSLPESDLSRALGGENITLPVASLSPQQQGLVQKYIGGESTTVATDAQGKQKVVFDSADVAANGTVNLMFGPTMPGDPKPELRMTVETVPGMGGEGGGPLLYRPGQEEHAADRAAAGKRREAKVMSALDRATTAKTVTIRREMKTQTEAEPPLAAYLRTFTDQTGFTLLGRWPEAKTNPLFQSRLRRSLVRCSPGEAISALARAYGAGWSFDGTHTIRFWTSAIDTGKSGASGNAKVPGK